MDMRSFDQLDMTSCCDAWKLFKFAGSGGSACAREVLIVSFFCLYRDSHVEHQNVYSSSLIECRSVNTGSN